MAYILNPEEQQIIKSGGIPSTINSSNPESQQAYADFVRVGQAGGQTITGGALTPIPSIPFTGSTTQPTTPASTLDVPTVQKTEATPTETSIESLLKEIQTGQTALAGQETFRQEKEKEFGVVSAETTFEDMSRQLRDLQREEKAVPIAVQQEFAGRGVTKGGVAPIEAGRLREISLRSLTLSSSLDAAAGLLSSANRKVERAIKEKYGQQEEDIKIKLANLDILLKSPTLDREQKDRALAQQLNLKAQQDKIAENKKNEEAAQKKSNDIISLNKDKISATQIDEMKKLTNETNVLAYAINNGLLTEKGVTTGQSDFEQAFLRDNKRLPTVAEILEFKAKESAAGRAPSETKKPTTLQPEDRRTLIGTNLNDEMLLNIEEGVRTIGIDKVLEDDYSDEQKKAIRKVYGAESKEVTKAQVLQAAQAMKQADVENFFTARFTEDELNKFTKEAGFAGFFKKRATERTDYFASPSARTKLAELLEEQYKEQGYTIK